MNGSQDGRRLAACATEKHIQDTTRIQRQLHPFVRPVYASFAAAPLLKANPRASTRRGNIRTLTNRLNLASNPFTNRVLPWVVTAIMVLFSLLAMAFIARSNSESSAKAAAIQRDINVLEQQKLSIKKEAETVKNSFTLEQQLSLKSAHELVDRKGFSWSRLFADLEDVLPQSVRVGRIAVRQVHSQGDHMVANLELTVTGKSPTAVTDMIAAMNKEGIFEAELRTQNLQKGRGESGSEYELAVLYTPRSSFASTPDLRVANEQSTAGGGSR